MNSGDLDPATLGYGRCRMRTLRFRFGLILILQLWDLLLCKRVSALVRRLGSTSVFPSPMTIQSSRGCISYRAYYSSGSHDEFAFKFVLGLCERQEIRSHSSPRTIPGQAAFGRPMSMPVGPPLMAFSAHGSFPSTRFFSFSLSKYLSAWTEVCWLRRRIL